MKTQLEQQNSPSPEEKEEKKAKQKRRRKKASAPAPQSSAEVSAVSSAPEAPPAAQHPKKKRTVALSGAGHAFSFFAACRDFLLCLPSGGGKIRAAPGGGSCARPKKERSASKQKSAQPQKLPITPAPSALTSPAALGRQSSPKRKTSSSVRIISLGGLHEIGKNMTVIEYGSDIVGVDCGLSLSRRNHAGRGTR